MRVFSLETAPKIKLPPRWSFGPFLSRWVKEPGLKSGVMAEWTNEGILTYTAQKWDEVYAEKLKMGTPLALDLSEVSGDDLIF